MRCDKRSFEECGIKGMAGETKRCVKVVRGVRSEE